MADDASKLQSHLNLLRQEYMRLQAKHAELEKKYQVALAAAGQVGEDNFVSRLMKTVADLFGKELYSDVIVKLEGKDVNSHKFVLAARSDYWGVKDLHLVTELDLQDIPYPVGYAMMQWVYTDKVDLHEGETFLLDLLKAASKFRLLPLAESCEKSLMTSVNVKNCIRFYQTAEEIGAETLKEHCSELISNHWNVFTKEDFESMPAALAYKMFKAKSEFPLHTSIRAHREDVVFLYLVEHNLLLPNKLNEVDTQGDLSLDLALVDKQGGIAQTLVDHRVDVDRCDHSGRCLLHKAIKRGDEYAAKFLIEKNANVNLTTPLEKETALHLVASFDSATTSQDVMTGMANVAKLLIEHNANVNAQDTAGNSPLHYAIRNKNEPVFTLLLAQSQLNLELQNAEGETALWLALQSQPHGQEYSKESLAAKLIDRGSSPNATNSDSGDCLLHIAARAGHEMAALFLANNGANGSLSNHKGETPLHTAAYKGLSKLTAVLLEKGANPNSQTSSPIATSIGDSGEPLYRQTPLHLAIMAREKDVVNIFLDFKASVAKNADNLQNQILPNFTIKDSRDQTVLAVALWTGFHDIASQLLTGGANINDYNSEGMTMLHEAIMKQDAPSALFLLDRQADANLRTKDNETCLVLAIKRHLPKVVDALCKRGAEMNVADDNGDCPLWMALETGQEDIASILVQHGCDTNMWGSGPSDCQQTLLHRAIDESNESVACFLIRSGCDINAPRRPGPNGEGEEESRDGQGPLHLAGQWGLEHIIQTLVEFGANVNQQDAEGKTPIHIAIENQHHVIISLLMSHPGLDLTLKDRHGLTPFAAAMLTRNNKAAQAILDREPTAAEQFDNKGRNFLHLAVQKNDMESVLFLISVRANVNSRVQDASQMTPLHLAVQTGSDIMVRNLILAGAHVDTLTPQKQNALHIATAHDHHAICSILLENSINYDQLDDKWNNPLHIAVQMGHLATCRTLLTESRINADISNMRGMNPLHILGHYGKENASAIFDLFIECMPEYPIDKPDGDGNTALLLAYSKGNGNLCRAIVRAGARLGEQNKEGVSIFNAPVATKQLLFKLLDMLSKEPPWSDGEHCLECGVKFSIKTRKHHCRHCGRLVCSKCSQKEMPIIKYNIPKPVRVCEVCFDVLTLGGMGS